LGRSPDTASVEDLRRYQLHLVDRGISPVTLNATITGLKFFFEVTLSRPDLMAKMHPVRVAQTLPVILTREEVGRLIDSARTLKHCTALSVAYGAGLRVMLNKTLKPLLIPLILASVTPFVSTAQAGPALGDTYEGGTVFYVSADGQHGLIAAPADLDQA
jgi:hypothetical protein